MKIQATPTSGWVFVTALGFKASGARQCGERPTRDASPACWCHCLNLGVSTAGNCFLPEAHKVREGIASLPAPCSCMHLPRTLEFLLFLFPQNPEAYKVKEDIARLQRRIKSGEKVGWRLAGLVVLWAGRQGSVSGREGGLVGWEGGGVSGERVGMTWPPRGSSRCR